MKTILLSFFIAAAAMAFDGGSKNHSGTYTIVSAKACGSYGLYVSCKDLVTAEVIGQKVSIAQNLDEKNPTVCVARSFSNGLIGANEVCYQKTEDIKNSLAVTGSGFKGRQNQDGIYYFSEFRRSGAGYTLKDGGGTKGLDIYYTYELEKRK